MKTKSRIYQKEFFLCVATVWLLALGMPAIAGQDDSARAKPAAAAAAAEQSQKKPDSGRSKAKDEKATEKTAGAKATPSPRGVSSLPVNRTASPTVTPPIEQRTQPTTDIEARIANLEGSYVSQDVFGLLTWPTLILGLVAVLLFIALSLHLLHFFRLSNLTNFVDQLAKSHAALGQAAKGQRSEVNNTAVERLTAELDRHDQVLKQFSTRLNQVDGRLTSNDNQFEDAAHAITLAANWIGQSQIKTAFATDAGGINDTERASAIAMLERYREPLRQNANRVEPVSQALAELVDSIGRRAYVSSELCSRLQGLYQGIHRFDQWHAEVEDELNSLQLGSLNQRSHLFHVGQTRLLDEVNQGSMSVAQMVQKSRELTENYFPERAQRPVRERLALADREANLKKILEGACDYLMDWYNSLFQFQNQLEQGQRSAAEAELAAELARVQQLAREALNKYDLQPEAIHIGQTQYDRRLHEAILVRQSQFPLNTVIEIHECGFRKMSTGEALRRPQVSVAGARAV